MPEKSLFDFEKHVIEKARHVLEHGEEAISREEYAELLDQYIRLYRETTQLIKVTDMQQKKLTRLNKKLQATFEELREARRLAEAASQAKSTFLANMSHELRTPLNAILGFSQILARSPHTIEEKEHLSIIQRSGDHLLTLINQVLDLSKIEAGRITLNEKDVDLFHLLKDLQDMFSLKAETKQLQIHFEKAENVPRYVRTDDVKLRQVLINLLGNALKFTDEGTVNLSVYESHEFTNSSTHQLVFDISDTGVGIAPEELDTLFKEFVQTASGRKSREGTGLGMSISRKFIQLMGGDISVNSEPGKGTTVICDIRAGRVGESAMPRQSAHWSVMALEPGQPCYRLLIVSSRPENRTLLVKLLSRFQFELKEACHGQEAIELWRTWNPHLIWMELRMPIMDGYEATRQIRQAEEHKNKDQALANPTVIIALSSSRFEENRSAALSKHCDDVLRKPFREADILEMLRTHLGVRFLSQEDERLPRDQSGVPGETSSTDIPQRDRQATDETVLTPEALAALPHEMMTELEQAVNALDIGTVQRITTSLREHNEPLAEALAKHVMRYRFDILQDLCRRA